MLPTESAAIQRLLQRLVSASSRKNARARRAAIWDRDYNPRPMSILVGIAGGSGSGKTSFAGELQRRLGADRALILAQDSYYKDGSTLSPEARAAINYDHPDAFDTSLLVQDLRDLKAGRPVPCLTYDHAAYSRSVLPDPLTPKPVLLLEGILILAEEPLRR